MASTAASLFVCATILTLAWVAVVSADNYAETLCGSSTRKDLSAAKALAERIEREHKELPQVCKGKLKQATKQFTDKTDTAESAFAFIFMLCCEEGNKQILYMEVKSVPLADFKDPNKSPFKEQDHRYRFWDYKALQGATREATVDAWTTAWKLGVDVTNTDTGKKNTIWVDEKKGPVIHEKGPIMLKTSAPTKKTIS